jgi:hypothetical protein
MSLDNPKETLKAFKESRDILKNTPEYGQLVQELQYHIDNISN